MPEPSALVLSVSLPVLPQSPQISYEDRYRDQMGTHAVEAKSLVAGQDVYVTYHGEEDEQVRIDNDHFGYGYGGAWFWGGGMELGTSTSRVRTYTEGRVANAAYHTL